MSAAARMIDLALHSLKQFRPYFVLAALVLVLTGVGAMIWPALFRRFIGQLNPVLVLILTAILGLLGLWALSAAGWFPVYAPAKGHAVAALYLLVPLYAGVTIAIDIVARFARDINIAFPGSLFFYPPAGFVAEIVFHVLPLAALLLALPLVFKTAGRETLLWSSIAVAALVEPVFQTILVSSSSPLPLWATILSATNILAIDLTLLVIFRSAGFIHMYGFRLAYYALWHIVWGHLRLATLF